MASKYDELSPEYQLNAINNFVLQLMSVNKSDWVDIIDLDVVISMALQGHTFFVGEETCKKIRQTYLPQIKELVENGELEYRVKIYAD